MPEARDPKVGKGLRRKRRRLEITEVAVAAVMGVSRQAVHKVERLGATPSMAARYEAALAAIRAARK